MRTGPWGDSVGLPGPGGWEVARTPPGDRGVEIDSALADDITRTVILDQVEMGVAVRQACLEVLSRDLPNIEHNT